MTHTTLRWMDTAARVLVALLFLYSGFGKLMDPGAVATRLGGIGFPFPDIVAYMTIALELGGAIALIAGYRVVVLSLLLAGFTLLTALLFHQFWAVDAAQQAGQRIHFLKNLAIIGGLWFVARTQLVARVSSSHRSLVSDATAHH
ncbi:DoxX family protein [Agrobacterium fabrum]|uniref:DoxX family protein n=1 Tax=Agrobacterium fabrum TaxID=1176649 RepID=UPI002158309A|nr:DoxX family protein [Agrobacterium fabrum]MCR6727724.1 DoxX family protein [Agrobacterium fabrum]